MNRQMLDIVPIKRQRDNAEVADLNSERPGEAEFNVLRVKPGVSVLLPRRYFEFSSFDAASSFTIEYRLAAGNVRAPKMGKLHVRIRQRDNT
jgi:hypothetical protein